MSQPGSALPPLHGVRVLDLTQVIAGPMCTMLLADVGAEVVKIEPPGQGDDLRFQVRYAGRGPQDEDYFYTLNRRKKSVVLDLKTPEGQRLALALAERADVLVQNFAPGTAERLGMGWEQLRPRNPRLVYCALSGFGQTGPYRDRPAMDPIIQAMSGLMSVTGYPDGEPLGVGMPIVDSLSGITAAFAVVAALHAVGKTGRGTFIDLSMLDATLAALGPRMGEPLQAGIAPGRHGTENAVRMPSGLFRGSDGAWLMTIVQSDRHWPAFCRALEREEWLDDPRFATMADRLRHRKELRRLVAEQLAERPAAEWIERLLAHRIPAGPVNDYLQAVADPQVQYRRLIREVEHPRSGRLRLVGSPWAMEGIPEPPLTPPPLLGEHTHEVLADWLGDAGSDTDPPA